MKLQESLAEASREGRGRLGDAALGTCELCRKSGQEVVLGLLRRQNGNRRQYTECICRKENHVLRCRSVRNRLNNLFDVINRIRHAGVLRNALIGEINLAVCIDRHVLQKSVTANCAVDIRLGLLVEVDDLCIATALKVEHAGIIPTVLIIADEKALRIRGKRGLTGTGETEEHCGVLAIHVGIRRAVHRSNAAKR